jgi:flagellar P-ring protein precursor FlgI
MRPTVLILLAATLLALPRSAMARVRLQDICAVYGQREVQLVGMGLVVGLNGTGDGGKSAPAVRALAMTLKNMNSPATEKELSDAKNVALVVVHATVPRQGLRRGQTIDCYVSSVGGAKSLRGGRLLPTPLETVDLRDDKAVALAGGGIRIDGKDSQTTGVIPNGTTLEQNFVSLFIDTKRNHTLTLLLDEAHESFLIASEIANILNNELSPDGDSSRRTELAKAVDSGVIEIQLPPEYRDDPVAFVGLVLNVGIDTPQSQARVMVNTKTQQIVVTGEVEIGPVIVRSKSLTVEVGANAADGTGAFVPVVDPKTEQGSQKLTQLLAALRQLEAPQDEVIDIIREIHRSGVMHAVYEER